MKKRNAYSNEWLVLSTWCTGCMRASLSTQLLGRRNVRTQPDFYVFARHYLASQCYDRLALRNLLGVILASSAQVRLNSSWFLCIIAAIWHQGPKLFAFSSTSSTRWSTACTGLAATTKRKSAAWAACSRGILLCFIKRFIISNCGKTLLSLWAGTTRQFSSTLVACRFSDWFWIITLLWQEKTFISLVSCVASRLLFVFCFQSVYFHLSLGYEFNLPSLSLAWAFSLL